MMASRTFALIYSWFALLAAATSAQLEDNAAEALYMGRRLLDAAPATTRTALTDRTLAFMTKYELPAYKTIDSTAKVYALFGWQDTEKSIKYSVLTTEGLTAKTADDIKGLHLGVKGTRAEAAKAEMPLDKYSGAFPEKDGYQILGVGTIKDANVSSWTNSLDIKTAAQLWELVAGGQTYLTVLTTKYPEGEVRGQIDWSYEADVEAAEDLVEEDILEDTDNWRLAFLTPYEHTTNVVGSKASRAIANVALDGDKIVYHVVSGHLPTDNLHQVTGYSGIKAVQLHVGALRGKTSAAFIPLTVPTGDSWKIAGETGLKVYAQGEITDATLKTTNANASALTITSAKALFDKVRAGETYINILTTANPTGELRGQDDWNYKPVDTLKDLIPPIGSAKAADTPAGTGTGTGTVASKNAAPALTAAALPLLLSCAAALLL